MSKTMKLITALLIILLLISPIISFGDTSSDINKVVELNDKYENKEACLNILIEQKNLLSVFILKNKVTFENYLTFCIEYRKIIIENADDLKYLTITKSKIENTDIISEREND
ncbi:hypothetical protein KAR91_34940 [Candidatus Pacearchaeota archaeon]|nr:hypothetical protein [Candidatus Pacearchaeota archaeon]